MSKKEHYGVFVWTVVCLIAAVLIVFNAMDSSDDEPDKAESTVERVKE